MEQQTNQWLKQTLLWQRIIVIGLGFTWLSSLVGVISQPFFWYDTPDIGELIVSLLAAIVFLSWGGLAIWRLYKNIQSTQKYLTTQQSIHWQEAMQQQYHFWKHFVLMALVGILFLLVTIAFLIVLFAGMGQQ